MKTSAATGTSPSPHRRAHHTLLTPAPYPLGPPGLWLRLCRPLLCLKHLSSPLLAYSVFWPDLCCLLWEASFLDLPSPQRLVFPLFWPHITLVLFLFNCCLPYQTDSKQRDPCEGAHARMREHTQTFSITSDESTGQTSQLVFKSLEIEEHEVFKEMEGRDWQAGCLCPRLCFATTATTVLIFGWNFHIFNEGNGFVVLTLNAHLFSWSS